MSLSLSPNRRRSQVGQMTVTGAISNGSDWTETLTLTDANGDQITGVGSDTFKLQLRSDPDDTTTDLELGTGGDGLTVTVGASSTTLAISVDQGDLSGLEPADYIIDIVSETSGGTSTHRAHGLISVRGSPIAI